MYSKCWLGFIINSIAAIPITKTLLLETLMVLGNRIKVESDHLFPFYFLLLSFLFNNGSES